MKAAEYRAIAKTGFAARKSKYGNVRTIADGHSFASKKEAMRFAELKLLERRGEISALKLQPRFHLEVNGVHVCDYLADFSYRDKSGALVVEDVKSPATAGLPVFRLKRALMGAIHGIDVVMT